MITNINASVRMVSTGDPFKDTHDLIVEVLKNGEWTYFRGFNTFSNDYAYSEARQAANQAMDQMEQLESDRVLGAE